MADLAAIRARHTALAGYIDRQLHDDVAALLDEIDRLTPPPPATDPARPPASTRPWDPGPQPPKYGP